jgi:hypothetical protein
MSDRLNVRGGRFFLSIVLLLCLAVSVTAATEARLTAHLDRTIAPVGETVSLTLAYTLPAGCRLPDKPEIEGLSGLSIMNIQAVSGSVTVRFIVDSVTDISIGPLGLTYLDPKGARQKITADKLTLKVSSNLEQSPDKQQLKPLQDIIPARPVWLAWLRWGALVLLVVLVFAGLVFGYTRWRGRKAGQASALPPHVRAQLDLEALVTGGLFDRGEVKAFYFRFSEILKRYLEELRGYPAAEYTSEEIASRVVAEIDRDLVVVLKRSDLVKFADDVPAPARKDEDVKAALAYIAATAPRPEPEEKSGGKA